MGLRMKNFNIISVHWKIQFLGEGSQKTYKEELPKTWGLDSLQIQGKLGKKGRGGGGGGGKGGGINMPMHTMEPWPVSRNMEGFILQINS